MAGKVKKAVKKKVVKTVKAVKKKVLKPVPKKKLPVKKPVKAKAKLLPKKAKAVAGKPAAKPIQKVKTPVSKPVRPITAKKEAVKPVKAKKFAVKPVEEEVLPKVKPMSQKDLDYFKDLLLKLRDRLIDGITFLATDNLSRSPKDSSGDLSSHSFHMADQGSDNFDREFAANLLSGEQDVLYEINEAIRRIEQGTFGVCEMSGLAIERERLKVLPYARFSVAVQSEMERGKPRYRPFKRTSIQSLESAT